MTASALALAWGLMLPLSDDGTVLPEAVAIQARLPFLQPGMERGEVERFLGLDRRVILALPNSVTLGGMFETFPIATHGRTSGSEQQYSLTLSYHYEFSKKTFKLTRATLGRGNAVVARVPPEPGDKPVEAAPGVLRPGGGPGSFSLGGGSGGTSGRGGSGRYGAQGR